MVDVTYDTPVINSGPLSLGLTELPAAPEVTFALGEGSPAGGGATGYGLADVVSANLIFGDGVFTALSAFDMEVLANGSVESLTYQFSPIGTPTAEGYVVLNFPLSITGTDIASGEAFSYTYANSTETLTAVPEPTTFALCAVLGFVGVVSRHRRLLMRRQRIS